MNLHLSQFVHKPCNLSNNPDFLSASHYLVKSWTWLSLTYHQSLVYSLTSVLSVISHVRWILVRHHRKDLRGVGMVQWRERSPLPMWPGFDSGPVPYLGCVCCPLVLALFQGFSPGSPVFFPPLKPKYPNSNSTRTKVPHYNQLRLIWFPLEILWYIY